MEDGDPGEQVRGRPLREPTRYHDDSTYASDPIPVEVADERLQWFCPELYGWSARKAQHKRLRQIIVEHMSVGDSRAAVVVSEDPLLVAACTDQLDCVAICDLYRDPQPQSSLPARGSLP